MRGQKGVCLLCRHVLESQQNTNVTKRFRSSLAKEPYVLPRLVIDLDAADSKLVRKLDDLEEDTPEPLENLKAKQHRLYEEMKKGDRKFKQKVPLKTLNTTPPDLLFYALLGDPIASQTKKTPQLRNSQLRTLFRSRMIQPEDSAETKLQQLTLKYTANEAERLRSSGFGEVDEVAIVEQIRGCRIFSKLHRMISMLSQTREGCQFLGRNGSTIIKSISSSRRVQPMSPPVEKVPSNMVLRMFNNLQLNMESKGVQLGTYLCNGALHYAGRSYNLPAVRKYLQILRSNSYATDWRTVSALKHVFQGTKSTPRGIDPSQHYKREEILRLLSGWEKGGIPRDGEQRDISFADIFGQDYSVDFTTCLYPRYIIGLGELGLNDALWAEWESQDQLRIPVLIQGDGYRRFRARMFALAFMVAKDQQGALEVLESVPIDHDDNGPADYAKLIQSWDHSVGGNIIASNRSSGEWLLALISEHFTFHTMRMTNNLLDFVKTTLKELSKDPLKTFNALNRLLAPEVDIDFTTRKVADWSWKGQKEGLMVMSEEDGVINRQKLLYWKPDMPIFEPPVQHGMPHCEC